MDHSDDIVLACVDLAARSGAKDFEIGHTEGDDPTWWAVCSFGKGHGQQLLAQGHASPTAAALALSMRLLRGAQCRCGSPVTLSDVRAFSGTLEGCRWRLVGQRWEPGCDAPGLSRDEAAKRREQWNQ